MPKEDKFASNFSQSRLPIFQTEVNDIMKESGNILRPLKVVGEKKNDQSLYDMPSQDLGVSKRTERERAFMNVSEMRAEDYE